LARKSAPDAFARLIGNNLAVLARKPVTRYEIASSFGAKVCARRVCTVNIKWVASSFGAKVCARRVCTVNNIKIR